MPNDKIMGIAKCFKFELFEDHLNSLIFGFEPTSKADVGSYDTWVQAMLAIDILASPPENWCGYL